jgi:PLP dependent protein
MIEALEGIRARIVNAGGDLDRVRIVAITKTFGPDAVIAAVEAGIADVGENYAQEAVSKQRDVRELRPDLEPQWHFVGHLQRNKVKMLVPFVHTWQSIDSIALVDELVKRAPRARMFVEVNLTGEPGRGGCSWDSVHAIVEHARSGDLDVRGLMGIGPLGEPQDARPHFARLANVARELEVPELSMGMSDDLEVAIREGATVVRIGRAFFGARHR